MDGDSSTTDASQLRISADYIGGVIGIQPHDGKKATIRNTFTSRKNEKVEILLT